MLAAFRLNFRFAVLAYNASKNYYKVLNISESATSQDIKKAFRDLAKKYHPDSNKGKEQLFKQVNEAYQVLSDANIKQEYDQVRKAESSSRSSSYQSQSGFGAQSGYGQQRPQSHSQSHSNQYRGYQKQQGWKDMNFRDQFMHDLHRQQQAQHMRNFQKSHKEQFQRQFRERMQEAMRQQTKQNIRKYDDKMKAKQAQSRKTYEEQEERRKQQEFEMYKRYRDESFHDINDKMKEKLNKMAQGVADNVKDALKVGEIVKDIWSNFMKKKK